MEANRFVQRMAITSGGGYAGPELEAAQLIRRKNLSVRVESLRAGEPRGDTGLPESQICTQESGLIPLSAVRGTRGAMPFGHAPPAIPWRLRHTHDPTPHCWKRRPGNGLMPRRTLHP